jgi:hypothetical protein
MLKNTRAPISLPVPSALVFRFRTKIPVSPQRNSWRQCDFIEKRSGRGRDIRNDEILLRFARKFS